jgi:hypothetical protein
MKESPMKRLAGAALAAAVTAGLLTAPAPAHAASAPTRVFHVETEGAVTKQAKLQSVLNYWTEGQLKRIDEAMYFDHTVADTNDPELQHNLIPAAEMTQGGPWDDKGEPWPEGQGQVSQTVGKLFVKMKRPNGTTYNSTCSANIVTSGNKSTVMTAGHCLRLNVPGAENATAENAIFIPAFKGDVLRQGDPTSPKSVADIAPHGIWVVTQAFITWGWNFSPNWVIGHDVGSLVVQRHNDTQLIEDVVGATAITFTRPQNAYVHVFGYPSSNQRNWYAPALNKVGPSEQRTYDGRRLFHAEGQGTTGSLYVDTKVPAALSPGTSGGPLLYQFSNGTGVQMGVASRFDDPANPFIGGWSLGPNLVGNHLGDEERLTYEAAAAVTITQ